jgi:hypothetical protein
MTYTAEQIITDINAYMRQHPGTAAVSWYVGIATNPKQRLFNDHNVSESSGAWIYRQALSSTIARAVEKAYLNSGHSGGPGGGDDGTAYVYAYIKTSYTIE